MCGGQTTVSCRVELLKEAFVSAYFIVGRHADIVTTLAFVIPPPVDSSFASRASRSCKTPVAMASYSLPNLPYAYDALEPFVDAMTMEIHHSKHHQTYVNNLNAALEKAPELAGLDLLALNKAVGTGKVPDSVATAVRNNGGGTCHRHNPDVLRHNPCAGHWNHTFFWQVMGKPGDNNGPSAELKSAIDASFGSLDKLKSDFGAAGALIDVAPLTAFTARGNSCWALWQRLGMAGCQA